MPAGVFLDRNPLCAGNKKPGSKPRFVGWAAVTERPRPGLGRRRQSYHVAISAPLNFVLMNSFTSSE
jgi:hypothetical protein